MKDIKTQIMDICRNEYPYELDYIYTHIERYYQTFNYIKDYIKPEHKVLDVGGNNNGSTFVRLVANNFKCSMHSYDKDLRYPFTLPDNYFDFIICMEIIEHIKDRNSDDITELSQFNWNGINNLTSEIHRILKPGGIVLITTPNVCSYDCIYKALTHKNPYHYLPHVKEFGYDELLEHMDKFGFKRIKSETINSWTSITPDDKLRSIQEFIRSSGFSNDNRNQNTFYLGYK